jgi:Flp pilus assembly pilin Flp
MKPEDGQDLVEYAVLIGVIAIVATAALIGLGPGGLDVFSVMGDRIAACIKFDTATCAGS